MKSQKRFREVGDWMKVIIKIMISVLLIAVFLFRFQLLGFYHELRPDEIVDLGGYGRENVLEMVTDNDGNTYVLSTSADQTSQGIPLLYEDLLLTKINTDQTVESSIFLQEEMFDYRGSPYVMGADMVLVDGSLFIMTRIDSVFSTDRDIHLVKVDSSLETITYIDLDEYDKFLNIRIDVIDDQLIITDHDVTIMYTFDTNLELISETELLISFITNIIDIKKVDDTLYFVGSMNRHAANDVIYVLLSYDIDTRTQTRILTTEGVNGKFFYRFEQDVFRYTTTLDDGWDITSFDVHSFEYESPDTITTVSYDMPYERGEIIGWLWEEETVYFYGITAGNKFSDGIYYQFEEDGTLIDSFQTKIGGHDSIIQLHQMDGGVISVIKSKRIHDSDYFSRGSGAYDSLLKFHTTNSQ